MVCSSDGIWNEKGTSIKIIILPPWWQTKLAQAGFLLIIISLFLAFYFYRINKLQSQKKILEKLVDERTNELNIKANQLQDANTRLEEQSEELKINSEILQEKNRLLIEKQEIVIKQSEQLKENNAELSVLNATKDQFFSIIAHDLKNPFNAILGFSDLLTNQYDRLSTQKIKQLIDVINSSSKRVYKLLENLLQWARSQTGDIKFDPEELIINELIENNISLLENSITEKHLEIKKEMKGEIKAYADKNMLDAVIRNLIINAVKFTKSGSISIAMSQDNENTLVSVSDTGIGIEPEKISKIFDAANSKSTLGTNGETGSGLGLILCKEFIKKHGGTISVQSELNKGSTFLFTIPVLHN
jgi:signal transduction histidine kinase